MKEIDHKILRPARSVLFNLEPIGVGTAAVESLESYTCRLGERHGVPRRTFENFVNDYGEPLYSRQAGPPRLDSPTPAAANFAQRLAQMTGQASVPALGLSRYAGRLATFHTLRCARAWCGLCFHEMRVKLVPPHLPLLWSLADYSRCTIHGQVLETKCRACGLRSLVARSWNRPLDHCPRCAKDLATGPSGLAPSFAHLARRGKERIDMFCGGILGDFVAATSQSTRATPQVDITRVIDSAIERRIACSQSDLARRAGLTPGSLSALKRGTMIQPSLSVLLRLAAAADVSLAGILDGEQWREGIVGRPPPEWGQLPPLRTKRRHDWPLIQNDIATAMASGVVLPLQRLARQLGVDQSYLAAGLGDLRAVIIERSRAARAAERQGKLTEMVAKVAQARETLLSRGSRPSARAVCELLKLPGQSGYFRKAFEATQG